MRRISAAATPSDGSSSRHAYGTPRMSGMSFEKRLIAKTEENREPADAASRSNDANTTGNRRFARCGDR
jgi:hypothetical protein